MSETKDTDTTEIAAVEPVPFVHLHCHSEFSSLDGGSRVTKMPEILKEKGMTAMGLTDHGVMQGLPEFQDTLRKEGIKSILGNEIYLTGDRHNRNQRETPTWHLTLLAETSAGYQNLCKISSWSFIEGRITTFGRARARADWELLERHSEGIICLTGCMAGPVMSEIMQTGDLSKARERTERLVRIFGAENVYGEIQNVGIMTGIPADSEVARVLGKAPLSAEDIAAGYKGPGGEPVDEVQPGQVPITQTEANHVVVEEICKPLGLKYAATGDVHYLREEDAEPHDTMLCIGTGQLKKGPRRFSLLPKKYHLRSYEEMQKAIPEYPEALTETVAIADRCSAEITYGKELLPRFPIPEEFADSGVYLRKLCEDGLDDLYPEGDEYREQAVERLDMELGVIGSMGFNDYFLIVWDLFREARARNIPYGPGRGSAAGAIVAYTLGITQVDPLREDLLFERFLNPDRVSMPDIDMDFGVALNKDGIPKRDELIEYAKEKYNSLAGCDTAVTMIATFSKFKGKGALKDSARVLAEPTDEGKATGIKVGNKLASFIPNDPRATMRSVWLDKDQGRQLRAAHAGGGFEAEVIEQAGWMEGLVKTYGTHAAGVIIGDHDLTDDLPLQQMKADKAFEVQYDMGTAERIGLLKMDFLGLRNLDVIWDTIEKVKHVRGIDVGNPWRDIPRDDKKTYEMLARGESIGVFQYECLAGDTMILMDDGNQMSIAEMQTRGPDHLVSVDPSTGRKTVNEVLEYVESGEKQLYRVQVRGAGKKLRATADHRLMTPTGFKRVGDLKPGDQVLIDSADSGDPIGCQIEVGKVVSVDPDSVEKTYDIAMKAPLNNYIANGVVVHNSGGMVTTMRQIRPTEFSDLVAIVALYRPGAMAHIPTYADRKNGRQKVTYLDPRLEEITGDTYGVCVSGDALIVDADTGKRHRLSDLEGCEGMRVHGVDENWNVVPGTITRWIDSGLKRVYRVRLRSGAEIKTTADHRFLTEDGWSRLESLAVGMRVGTPNSLPVSRPSGTMTPDQARILGYLLGDGSLAGPTVDFITGSPDLEEAYRGAVGRTFDDVQIRTRMQARGVRRVTSCKTQEARTSNGYHSVSGLETWLRETGLRWQRKPDGRKGCLSDSKFVPPIVFEQDDDLIATILAALWDCDGHVNSRFASYKTISRQLADDVQGLLLRLGIRSASYRSSYESAKGEREAFQVTVHDGKRFSELIQPLMSEPTKRSVKFFGRTRGTLLSADSYLGELDALKTGSCATLARETSVNIKNHRARAGGLITAEAVRPVAEHLQMPDTLRAMNLHWDEILEIEDAGVEHVYDLTVDGLHSFVADNVIVHNCLYQEQSMLIARMLASFTPGQADDLRKAIGKKLKDKMESLRPIYMEGCKKNGVSAETAKLLWADNEAAADYSFNKAHADAYALISYVTAYLKANYPEEYHAALLSSVMGTKDKPRLYLTEAKRKGIPVLPPDINRSLKDFAILESEDESGRFEMLFGLNAIRGVGEKVVTEIKTERDTRGPFKSMFDLIRRMPGLNKTVLSALIRGGALDTLGPSRKGMDDEVEPAIDRIKKQRKASEKAQFDKVKKFIEENARAGDETDKKGRRKLDAMEKEGIKGGALFALHTEGFPEAKELEEPIFEALKKKETQTARAVIRKALKETSEPQMVLGMGQEESADGMSEKAKIEAAADVKVAERIPELRTQASALAAQVSEALKAVADREAEEMGLAAAVAGETDPPLGHVEWPELEKLNYEREKLGIYVTGHPLDRDTRKWAHYVDKGLGQIDDSDIDTTLKVVGALVGKQPITTRRGERMYKLTFEDLTGSKEVTVFPSTLEGIEEMLEIGTVLALDVRVEEDTFAAAKKAEEAEADDGAGGVEPDEEGKPVQLVAGRVYNWDPSKLAEPKRKPRKAEAQAQAQAGSSSLLYGTNNRTTDDPDAPTETLAEPEVVTFELKTEELTPEFVRRLQGVCADHPGESPLRLLVDGEKAMATQIKVKACPELQQDLKALHSAEQLAAV